MILLPAVHDPCLDDQQSHAQFMKRQESMWRSMAAHLHPHASAAYVLCVLHYLVLQQELSLHALVGRRMALYSVYMAP